MFMKCSPVLIQYLILMCPDNIKCIQNMPNMLASNHMTIYAIIMSPYVVLVPQHSTCKCAYIVAWTMPVSI